MLSKGLRATCAGRMSMSVHPSFIAPPLFAFRDHFSKTKQDRPIVTIWNTIRKQILSQSTLDRHSTRFHIKVCSFVAWLMTSRKLTFVFDFCSWDGRDPSLHTKFVGKYLNAIRRYWHFSKFNMTAQKSYRFEKTPAALDLPQPSISHAVGRSHRKFPERCRFDLCIMINIGWGLLKKIQKTAFFLTPKFITLGWKHVWLRAYKYK